MFRITENPPEAYINNKKVTLKYYSEKIETEIECNLSDLKGVNTSNFPNLLIVKINNDTDIFVQNASMFMITGIKRRKILHSPYFSAKNPESGEKNYLTKPFIGKCLKFSPKRN